MPELPEVEWVRRGLERARLRAPVVGVYRSRFDLRTGAHWARRLERVRRLRGATPSAVQRRGKHLIWRFDSAEGEELGLLIHLGMTGICSVEAVDRPRPAHTHLELRFDDGRAFRFADARRFGGVRVDAPDRLFESLPLCELGPEPLSPGFDGVVLQARLGKSRRPLRDALLDQRAVAGIGNIYAVEALWDAKLHPLLPCRRVAPGAWARLAKSLVSALQRGLAAGGTTIRDYRGVDGSRGEGANELRAYGRAGEPCSRCGATLRAFESGGRGGVLCPRDQTKRRVR